jgi:hypothetical protein
MKPETLANWRAVEENIDILISNLRSPIDEIDALACLMGMARKVDEKDRYGYDLEFLDEIVMRRIRKLARSCQDDLAQWQTTEFEDGVIKLHERREDAAP